METIYSNTEIRRMRQLFENNRRLSLKRNHNTSQLSSNCICSRKEANEQYGAK